MEFQTVVERVRGEFNEMPGLQLTPEQAARLLGLDRVACDQVIERLVAASFLTKQLGIDWRRGERWFMRWLVDGDQANNNGNWQWVTSVGVDPQPFYRRLYNPTRQLRTLDPDGVYVRRHVPELRDVPLEHLAEPCANGVDYPEPIVDQSEAREAALHGLSRNPAENQGT